MMVLASSSVVLHFASAFKISKTSFTQLLCCNSRVHCNNIFIRTCNVCDVLYVITSVMMPHNDPGYV
jgi:hypothetical protein